MREIKFRAFAPFDKTWHYWDVYGDYPQGIYGGLSNPQQYTGFVDKNGVEIYEGDFVEISQEMHKSLKPHKTTTYIVWNDVLSGFTDEQGYPLCGAGISIEVIGNIYEKTNKSSP